MTARGFPSTAMDLCCRRRWGAHCELLSAGGIFCCTVFTFCTKIQIRFFYIYSGNLCCRCVDDDGEGISLPSTAMDLCCRRRWGAHCELMSAGQWETVDVVDGRGAASGSWRRLPSQGTSTTTTSPPAQERSMPRVAQVRTRPRAARGGRDEGQVLLLRVGGVGGQLLLLLAGGEGGPLNSGVGFSCNNQPTGGGGVAREAVPVAAGNGRGGG